MEKHANLTFRKCILKLGCKERTNNGGQCNES